MCAISDGQMARSMLKRVRKKIDNVETDPVERRALLLTERDLLNEISTCDMMARAECAEDDYEPEDLDKKVDEE